VLINSAFIVKKNFIIIKMHGRTTITTITALPGTEFVFVGDINEPLSTCKYDTNNSTVGLYGHYFKIFLKQKRHV
jgi:hypothetical protein